MELESQASSRSLTRVNDFDFVAPIYDALSKTVFLGQIQRAQLSLLPQLTDVKKALILGGGTGWFLLEFLSRTPVEHVTYIEMSEAMLRKSEELVRNHRPEWVDRVEFRLGTQDSLTPADGTYDLIITNFFLDLFSDENVIKITQHLVGFLAPAGRWLFVEFHMPERGFRRAVAVPIFKLMFLFFIVFAKMESRRPPNYGPAFERIRMKIKTEQTFYLTMIRARILERA